MLKNRWLVTLGWLCLCLPPVAHAQGQAGSSVFIEELTTQEVSAALKAGKTTVIIPVGGSNPSPYNFEMNSATNICYITDDRNIGIVKIEFRAFDKSFVKVFMVWL